MGGKRLDVSAERLTERVVENGRRREIIGSS